MSESSHNQPSVAARASRTLRNLIPAKPRFGHLCQKCSYIIQKSNIIKKNLQKWQTEFGENQKQESFRHYKTLNGIVQSAVEGCHLCSLLHRGVLNHLRAWKRVSSYTVIFERGQYHGYIQIKPRGEQSTIVVDIMNPEHDMECYLNAPEQPHGTLRSFGTDSLESFSRAKMWLQTCLVEHQDMCRVNTPSSPLLRLVKVSVAESQVSLKLCETPFEIKEEPYLALSHCWGGQVSLQLTTKTRPSFLECIYVADLPQTFLDAVVIVARLGYRFIWIDSLCIIQDSKADWNQQVAIMGDIYQNSVCTIAPIHAENSSRGCFARRDPLALEACRIGDGESSFLDLITSNADLTNPDTTHPERPPLHRRAWVIQERILSPRTLYYGPDMIFWECIRSKASEDKPEMRDLWKDGSESGQMIRVVDDGGMWDTGMKCTFHCLLIHCREGKYNDWIKYWEELISEYTSCEITNFGDRWLAISGLAAKVEQQSGLELLRGLWKDHLREQLLWQVTEPEEKPKKSLETERAQNVPSWSWISIKAPIRWERPRHDRYDEFSWIADIRSATSTEVIIEAPLIPFSQFHRWEDVRIEDRMILKSRGYGQTIGYGQPNVSQLLKYPDEHAIDESEIWALQFARKAGDHVYPGRTYF
jgi:hypothetical protein